MSPALGLHFVHRIEWISSLALKLISSWRVNVLDRYFVVRYIGDSVLLELVGFRPLNVALVHNVPSLKIPVLPVDIGLGACDVFHI